MIIDQLRTEASGLAGAESRVVRRIAKVCLFYGVVGSAQFVWWLFNNRPWIGLEGIWRYPNPWDYFFPTVVYAAHDGAGCLLLFIAIGLLRFRRWSRTGIILWAILAIVTTSFLGVWDFIRDIARGPFQWDRTPAYFIRAVIEGAMPLCIALIIRRDEYRSLFIEPSARGFELRTSASAGASDNADSPQPPLSVLPLYDVDTSIARIIARVGLILASSMLLSYSCSIHAFGWRWRFDQPNLLPNFAELLELIYLVSFAAMLVACIGVLRGGLNRWRQVIVGCAATNLIPMTFFFCYGSFVYHRIAATQPSMQSTASYTFSSLLFTLVQLGFPILAIVLLQRCPGESIAP